ncbi:hypothetical protein [Demequina sp. SO4-18]|uniref:hypothetical protein n=1 Tax=Demequina sp. SO4-18 TaxID=3401026 RepID=UPI003B5C5718
MRWRSPLSHLPARTWWGLAVVLAAGVFGALGGTPAVAIAVLLVLSSVSLAQWWGAAAGIGASVLIWATLTFLVAVLAPYLSIPFRPSYLAVVGGASAFALLRIPTQPRQDPRSRVPLRALGASFAGAVAWLAGLVVAAMNPSGSAVSWAVHDDSSLDIWATMRNLRDDGLDTLNIDNPRPLEHVLTTAFVPSRTIVDGSGESLSDLLIAHASNWAIAIVVGTVLAGLIASHLVRGVVRDESPAVWIAAALGSLAILAGPATGFFLFRGQINGSLTMTLLFACIAIAMAAARNPRAAFQLQVIGATLIVLMWTPFAAVPGAIGIALAIRYRTSILTRDHLLSPRLVIVGGFALWNVVLFSSSQLIGLAGADQGRRQAAVSVDTYLPAPMSWWVFAIFTILVLAAIALLWKRAALAATVLATTLAGVVIGGAPLFAARGGFTGALEYYPSRYVHMAEVMLAPIAIGALCALLAVGAWALRTVSVACAAGVVASAIIADVPEQVQKWRPVPLLVASGDYYGPDDAVFHRIVEYADYPRLRVPWHMDEPFDDSVRRMLSVELSDLPSTWNTQMRSALRNRIDDEPERICEIAAASKRPVTIVTRDRDLPDVVAKQCESTLLDRVEWVHSEPHRETAS